MAVRKLNMNEDINDRINTKDVTLDSSRKVGDLFRSIDYLYNMLATDECEHEINYTLMALRQGYDEGIVSRTTINGFNKELDAANKAIDALIISLNKVKNYGRNHVADDVYNELDKTNDWFRNHKR